MRGDVIQYLPAAHQSQTGFFQSGKERFPNVARGSRSWFPDLKYFGPKLTRGAFFIPPLLMLIVLSLPIFASGGFCLIDCRENASDLPGVNENIETLLGASVGGFSTSFEEECEINLPVSVRSNDSGSNEFHEFSVFRSSDPGPVVAYHGMCGPNMTRSISYLFAPKSGEYINGSNTYVCKTTDYYPDDSYLVQPASRDQICLFGLRLVPPLPNQFGAAFWTLKQQVAYGFETSFEFQVISQSELCPVVNSPNQAKWCYKSRGGRGFAFVVQNEGSPGSGGTGDEISFKIKSVGTSSLGYSFSRNLAIEFDYYYDTATNDPSWNHIAVMVPVVKTASEGDNLNSADHSHNTLAMVEGMTLPALNEGFHSVSITYDVFNSDKWQNLQTEWYSRPQTSDQTEMLQYWSSNRLGLLSIELDGNVVLKTLVDIAKVVHADPVTTMSPDPPGPNMAYPGSAWVGFVAATGPDSYSSPVIVDWNYRAVSSAQCGTVVECAVGGDSGSSIPRFTLRNIGTVDVKLVASAALVVNSNSEELLKSQSCKSADDENFSVFFWNEIHPYFLGCEHTVSVGFDLSFITIADVFNVRSTRLTDPVIVKRDYVSSTFVQRELPSYCVIEHEFDPYRLSVAQCDCSFCNRVFNNQLLYAVFFSQLCSQRYSFACTCFEVSQMTADTYSSAGGPWRVISQPGYSFSTKIMQMQLHSVCTGCKFDHQCALMNPLGFCKTPSTIYRVGNPVKPFIGSSFESWSRGGADVEGTIKGSSCDCGDTVSEPPIYRNTRNTTQLFDVFLKAYLQGTAEDCVRCLRLAGSDCLAICGSAFGANYLHYSAGQSCATCIFSSPSLLDLTKTQQRSLRRCIYSAIEVGEDPWTSACVGDDYLSSNYLNGIATHYLAECPGSELGAVCSPNLFANPKIQMQAIARGPAEASTDGIFFPVWWDDVACLNAMCELQSKNKCYKKLYKIIFEPAADGGTTCRDLLGSNIACHTKNFPSFNETSAAAVLNRTLAQYAFTDPLNRSEWTSDPSLAGMRQKSLEVWASISPKDEISDLAQTLHSAGEISASSSWGDDYNPTLAVDNNVTTFWQSSTSHAARFEAVWEIDFEAQTHNAMGYMILWQYRAASFSTLAFVPDMDQWRVVDSVSGNTNFLFKSDTFFVFTRFKILMTLALDTLQDQIDLNFAYGIAEMEIYYDLTVSRLKPVQVVQKRQYFPHFAIDNDYATWYSSTHPVTNFSVNVRDDNIPVSNIALVRVVFRAGYKPVIFSVSLSVTGGASYTSIDAYLSSPNSYSLLLPVQAGANVSVLVFVRKGAEYFDTEIVQISEIEVFTSEQLESPVFPSISLIAGEAAEEPWLPGTTILPGTSIYLTNWSSSPIGDYLEYGIFTISLNPDFLPESYTVFSRSTDVVFVPETKVFGASLQFAVLVSDPVADLVLGFTAKPDLNATIDSVSLSPIRRLNLTVSGSPDWWEETFLSDFQPQGRIGNINDGNPKTEFRTQEGGSQTGGIVPDYKVSFDFPSNFALDMIFIDFSFRSNWFRIEQLLADGGSSPGMSCEWTATSASSSCSSDVEIAESANLYSFKYYLQTNKTLGSMWFSGLNLVLMESSAVDEVLSQPVLGVREVQFFSTFQILNISNFTSINNSPAPAQLTDLSFSSFYLFTDPLVVVSIDFQNLTSLKELDIRFSDNNPVNVIAKVSQDSCLNTEPSSLTTLVLTESSFSGENGYFPFPVRCIQITLSTGSAVPSYGVSEILVRSPEASFQAPVIASSLTSPSFALDGDPTTFAEALIENASTENTFFIRIDLGQAEDLYVFGFQAKIVPELSSLDPQDGIVLSCCQDTDGCVPAVSIPPSQASRYMFAPVRNCSEILVEFKYVSNSSEGAAFLVSDLMILASRNLALSATAVFNDSRIWANDVSKSNDGNLSTSWVSELDVNSALLTYSLTGNSIFENTETVSVSSMRLDFFLPSTKMSHVCQVGYSQDGLTWTPFNTYDNLTGNFLEITGPNNYLFSANFIQLNFLSTKPLIAASDASWASPIIAVSELSVFTLSTLQFGKSASSNVSADFIGPPWISFPPSGTSEYLVPLSNISGIVLDWLFPPKHFSVAYLSSGVWVDGEALVGAQNVSKIRIYVSQYNQKNMVNMSALSSVHIFSPNLAINVPIPSAFALDDSPAYLVDGDPDTVYTSNPDSPSNITFSFDPPEPSIGQVRIVWGSAIAKSFSISATLENGLSSIVFSQQEERNSEPESVVLLALFSVSELTVLLTEPGISVNEISIFSSLEIQPLASSIIAPGQVSFLPASAIDDDIFSMWMPSVVPATFTLDLLQMYPVKQVSILWGWYAADREIQVSSDGLDFTSVSNLFIRTPSSAQDILSGDSLLTFRYLRILLTGPYVVDPDLDPSGILFRPSIRDIDVVLDQNLNRNEADRVVQIPGQWWDFPPALTTDNNFETFWLSRAGSPAAYLEADLGSVHEIAGVQIDFSSALTTAPSVDFLLSTDCVNYATKSAVRDNKLSTVSLSGQSFQFQAKCVRVLMTSDDDDSSIVFGVSTFAIMQHVGGGGLFGIEAKVNGTWGTVFDSLAFAPFQPTQWVMLSNQQNRTQPVNGPTYFDEISNLVQIVATFSDSQVTIFRNGVQFGSSYPSQNIPWDMAEDVRLVVGVRSSAFVDANASTVAELVGGSSHFTGNEDAGALSPFFQGQIQSATLFSRALLPEEIQGLYLSATQNGTKERGCLCYDACPTGSNHHYPNVSVPCSGQGVCKRQYDSITGLPTPGVCSCSPGFSGDNCATHCSQNGGCCSIDDDCPLNSYCDPSSNSCLLS